MSGSSSRGGGPRQMVDVGMDMLQRLQHKGGVGGGGRSGVHTHMGSSVLTDERVRDLEKELEKLGLALEALLARIHHALPEVEQAAWEWVDYMLAPKVVLRQFLLALALQMGLFSYQLAARLTWRLINKLSVKGRQISETRRRMSKAKNYYEWLKCAERMDELEGRNKWREIAEHPCYNHRMLQERINQLSNMMQNGDVFQLMFYLRGGISRNQFGLLHESLYQHAYSGTKKIVERYYENVVKALNFVCDVSPRAPMALQGSNGNDWPHIGADTKLAFFNETRHAYGRTALLLSGGAGLGFYHVGLVKALFDHGLLPRVLSGASAGSIISSMIGVRTDEELWSMFTDGLAKLDFFKLYTRRKKTPSSTRRKSSAVNGTFTFDTPTTHTKHTHTHTNTPNGPHAHSPDHTQNTPMSSNGQQRPSSASPTHAHTNGVCDEDDNEPAASVSLLQVMKEVLLGTLWYGDGVYLMDTEHFRRRLKKNIGNYTFQEAFDRTGRILNIIVAPTNGNDPPRLLNYLTSPHVLVWSAAAVSSAAPGIFEPGYLYVRQADGSERPESSLKWYDGSVEKDLPMEQLSELFNINHFIVSQVNPQAALFSSISLPGNIWSRPVTAFLAAAMQFCKAQFRSWCKNVFKLLSVTMSKRKSGPWSLRGIGLMFTQDYAGRECDITIMPWAGHIGLVGVCSRILSNPTFEEYMEMLAYGERKTWPLLHAIRSHCVVEMCLEKCVQRLRRAVTREAMVREQQAAAAAMIHNTNALFAEDQSPPHGIPRLGERGRAPSFYTVPSLVNLSGHSVTDPVMNRRMHLATHPVGAPAIQLPINGPIGIPLGSPIPPNHQEGSVHGGNFIEDEETSSSDSGATPRNAQGQQTQPMISPRPALRFGSPHQFPITPTPTPTHTQTHPLTVLPTTFFNGLNSAWPGKVAEEGETEEDASSLAEVMALRSKKQRTHSLAENGSHSLLMGENPDVAETDEDNGPIKSHSMAQFYYMRSKSSNSLAKTHADAVVGDRQGSASKSPRPAPGLTADVNDAVDPSKSC